MWRPSGITDCGWASAQINQGYFFTKTGDCAEDSKVHEISRLCLSLRCLAVKGLRPNCTREGEREGSLWRKKLLVALAGFKSTNKLLIWFFTPCDRVVFPFVNWYQNAGSGHSYHLQTTWEGTAREKTKAHLLGYFYLLCSLCLK